LGGLESRQLDKIAVRDEMEDEEGWKTVVDKKRKEKSNVPSASSGKR